MIIRICALLVYVLCYSSGIARSVHVVQENEGHCYWWLWLSMGIVVGILVWEKWVRKKVIREKETRHSLVVNYDDNSEAEEFKKQINKLTIENNKLNNKIVDLEVTNDDLLKEINRLDKQLNESLDSRNRRTESKKPSKKESQTDNNARSILYADFINDGQFSHVTGDPNDDSNFELHLTSEKTASFVVYKPASPRIVRNPAAFLQGCEKQVIGQTGEIEIRHEGRAECDSDGQWKVLNNNKLNVIIR